MKIERNFADFKTGNMRIEGINLINENTLDDKEQPTNSSV